MNKTLQGQFQELCVEIEKLPASEQQTKVSIMAGDMRRAVFDHLARIRDAVTQEPA